LSIQAIIKPLWICKKISDVDVPIAISKEARALGL
jgi:hypothetical protein